MSQLLPSFIRVRQHPEKLVKSPSILVFWTPGEREVIVSLRGPQPREKVKAEEMIKPKEARKLGRALLRAANEAEGRPVPRLADASESPGTLINLRS
jgi:hypothetical protein